MIYHHESWYIQIAYNFNATQAKSVMQERYDRIQENIQKRERARKMSNEEVNENAIKAGLTAEEEKRLEGELAQYVI